VQIRSVFIQYLPSDLPISYLDYSWNLDPEL